MVLTFFKDFLITFLIISLFILLIEMIAYHSFTISLILFIVFIALAILSYGQIRFAYRRIIEYQGHGKALNSGPIETGLKFKRIKKNNGIILLEILLLVFLTLMIYTLFK